MSSRFRLAQGAMGTIQRGMAAGALNVGYAIEAEAKAITPVHGDPSQGGEFATFAPGEKPIGGTLRRSEHTVAFVDGERVGGAEVDGNREPIPDYPRETGVVVIVGTNVPYALFVHDGTVKMRARPFLTVARDRVLPKVHDLLLAGARRFWERNGALPPTPPVPPVPPAPPIPPSPPEPPR